MKILLTARLPTCFSLHFLGSHTITSYMESPYLIIVIGFFLLCFLALGALFRKLRIPPLIGYILLGWLSRVFMKQFNIGSEDFTFTIGLLSKIGITLLLFHIGIETNLKRLLEVIAKAGVVSFFEIFLSGAAVFTAAFLFGLDIRISLILGIAMTATSIVVSTYSWGERELNEKKEGAFLLDLASFDDIMGILLFSAFIVLFEGGFQEGTAFTVSLLYFFLKLFALIGGCYLFSHFAEKKIMTELIQYEKMPDSMLSVVGIGLLIAGVAAFLGFSLVIGGFFAGIAFSRDPRSVRMDASMKTLLDFFTPFFFFWIGSQITLDLSLESWHLFSILLGTAVAGKFLGVWLPSRLVGIAPMGALLLAVSMIPRAEVTMVVLGYGLEKKWLTESAYSSGALVVLTTSLLAAYFIRILLKKAQR